MDARIEGYGKIRVAGAVLKVVEPPSDGKTAELTREIATVLNSCESAEDVEEWCEKAAVAEEMIAYMAAHGWHMDGRVGAWCKRIRRASRKAVPCWKCGVPTKNQMLCDDCAADWQRVNKERQ